MRNRTAGAVPLPAPLPAAVLAIAAMGSAGCAPDDAGPSGAVPRYVLDEPEVVSGEFGSVNGMVERTDGTLLVADRISRELVLADLDAGTRTVVGSRGEGPEEYQSPSGLWPLPGDSALLMDNGNGRLVILRPDLSFGATRPMIEVNPDGGFTFLNPQAVDGAGHIYTTGAVRMQIGAGGGSSEPGSDSAAVVRTELSDLSADTVAGLAPQPESSFESRSGSDGNLMLTMQQTPYTPSDRWGVAPDGSVVIARASDYHLDWIAPDGSVRSGPPVLYDRVPVGQAEKEAWVAGENRPSLTRTILMGGGGVPSPGSGTSVSPNVTINTGGDDVDDYDWPETLPAFTGRIRIDSKGRAWLRRYQPAGAPFLYDIFTPDAEHAATVEMPEGRTVIGFGDGVAYATFNDEVDLVYIERYRLPGS